VLLPAPVAVAQTEEPPGKRDGHLGAAIGYATTPNQVGDIFGDGYNGAVFVNQKFAGPLGAYVSYGGIFLGEATPDYQNEIVLTAFEYFGSSFRNIAMRFTYVSIGPSLAFDAGQKHSFVFAGAVGFYQVVLDLDSAGGQGFTIRDDSRGWEIKAAYTFWLGRVFGLQLQFDMHTIDTPGSLNSLYRTFTLGDSNPRFYSGLIGVVFGYN